MGLETKALNQITKFNRTAVKSLSGYKNTLIFEQDGYLHTLDLNDLDKSHLREFISPPPAREVSLIYHKSQLKMQLIEALKNIIDGVIRGAISFSDVKIISPLQKK